MTLDIYDQTTMSQNGQVWYCFAIECSRRPINTHLATLVMGEVDAYYIMLHMWQDV